MRRLVAVALLAASAVACRQPSVGTAADRELQDRVLRIRAALVDGNTASAVSEIEALRNATESWTRSGALDAARADRILAAVEGVVQTLPLLNPPAPISTPSADEDRRETNGDEKDEDDEKGKGKGRGRD